MSNFNSSLHAIHCLLQYAGRKDKISIIKLLFLADKYQILRIGRTITGSNYYAMKMGPVSSEVYDILDRIEGRPSGYNKCDVDTNSISLENGKYSISEPIEYDELSQSDEDAIKYVCDKFGNMGSWDLVKYTHKFPEWEQHRDIFKDENKSVRLKENELLSIIDSSLGFSNEDVTVAHQIMFNE
jgi:uncharacterized phage-associated protein